MTRLLIEGQEVDLGEAVVALTKQANDITKPESIQADYSNTVTLPDTQKNRAILGFADEVGSETDVPYKVLDAQLFKDGVEVVPYGKAELMNGAFELDIYSGNRNFFDVIGDKSIRELDLSAYNHLWNYANVTANATNTSWEDGFVYDLYDTGKPLHLETIDPFDLSLSIFGRAVWEAIFKDAGFTYTGFSHPMFDKLLLPLTERFEFDDEYRNAREFKVTSNSPDLHKEDESATEKLTFNFIKDGYALDDNGGYNLTSYQYTVDATHIMTFSAGVYVGIETLSGGLKLKLTIRRDGVTFAAAEFENEGGEEKTFLSVTSDPKTFYAGEVIEVFVNAEDGSSPEQLDPDWYIYYEATGSNTPYFSATVEPDFPKGGTIELAKWLPDISQKDFVKALHSLFAMSFQSELYQDTIKIGQFREVVDNIPQTIDMSDRVHHPEQVRPSFKFGEFAQRNTILWKPDDTVTEGYNDGAILVNDTTLKPDKDLIKLPFAATENSLTPNVLSIPMWKAKPNTEPAEYEAVKVQPRLVVQGDEVVRYGLYKTVVSGEIQNGVEYMVHGGGRVFYIIQWYNTGEAFTGQNVARFEMEGEGFLAENVAPVPITAPAAYFVDPYKPYDLSIEGYIVPTFYSTLLAILDKTKVLQVQMTLPAEFIQNWDQSIPIWVDYWGQYFYINKIEEYIDEASLTNVELIRL